MHAAFKLLAGLAATVLAARAGDFVYGQRVMAQLSGAAADAMIAAGVADGSVNFRAPGGVSGRAARLSGTADAPARAAVIARLRQHPGIVDAWWVERPAAAP
ncbi:hypothetical protein [Sandarakinorhabdus sp.]|uniref:hypothetical protein n=1 Tax=Sandarakinorhabdus sp. TaxID=1916663 RepID=UPI00333ECC9E